MSVLSAGARKTVDATALYKAADGAALAIRVPTPSVPFPMKRAPSVPALPVRASVGGRPDLSVILLLIGAVVGFWLLLFVFGWMQPYW